MKTKMTVLALASLCALLVVGCGVSEKAHQKVVTELEQTKKKSENADAELKKVKQKMAGLGSICAESDKTIQRLNDDLKNIETEITEKESKVDRLMNPEEYAFSDAESLYSSSNFFGAMSNYKVFVQDFSNSKKVPLAQAKIEEIEQLIAQHKKDEAMLEREEARHKMQDEAEAATKDQRLEVAICKSDLTFEKLPEPTKGNVVVCSRALKEINKELNELIAAPIWQRCEIGYNATYKKWVYRVIENNSFVLAYSFSIGDLGASSGICHYNKSLNMDETYSGYWEIRFTLKQSGKMMFYRPGLHILQPMDVITINLSSQDSRNDVAALMNHIADLIEAYSADN